jgi:putative protein-disulfide isomerase
MCSWCWGFRPTWQRIAKEAPGNIEIRRILGGLAPDSEAPMPREMQHYLQDTWRNIQQRIPGTRFDFAFWERCTPRRSTYPACRAVIAARKQSKESEEPMILAIQQAYYLQARNPSDSEVLIAIAGETGLDRAQFTLDLSAAQTQTALLQEIAFGRAIGVQGFPSLVLKRADGYQLLNYDYKDPQVVLKQLA